MSQAKSTGPLLQRHSLKPFNIPDHERAAAASASATQVMAPMTPITAPAEIPRMSLPPAAAVEIPPEVPVSGAEQPLSLRRCGRATRRPKTLSDYALY